MRDGQFSRTALKVAASCVSLGQHPVWGPRLPEGLAETSERLILAAGLYSARALSAAKNPTLLRFYEWAERRSSGSFVGLARRKIFVDEQVHAALERGCRRVVVIGAGLDTLAYRLAAQRPELACIELDHPATSTAKARALAKLGRPANLSLVAADLTKTPLPDALVTCPAWDPSEPAVFVAEGLLMYLDDAAIDGLFAALKTLAAPGSRVVFSQLRDLDDAGWFVQASLKLIGEPWLSSCRFDQLPEFAERIGWRLVERGQLDALVDLEVFAVVEKPG